LLFIGSELCFIISTNNSLFLEILSEINCDHEGVSELINEDMEKINLVKLSITGVVEEKNHDFYDKFKGQNDSSNTLKNELGDGLDGIFGDKRKY